MDHRDRRRHALILGLCAGLLLAANAAAQPVIDVTQELDWEDPEAWALQFFSSLSYATSLGSLEKLDTGRIDLGFEVLSVPHLDAEQRRVGFGGFKVEDLNRSPVWGRLRARFGLPAGFGLGVGWVPPVEVSGVEPSIFNLWLWRPLWTGQRWGLGARVQGQIGTVRGDLTCSSTDLQAPPGEPGNLFGCQERSSDEVTLDNYGLELNVSRRSDGGAMPTLYGGLSWIHHDLELQVDALVFGVRDRTRLVAEGDTWAATVGAGWRVGGHGELVAETFYSPLEVRRRSPDTGLLPASAENDPVWNLRLVYRYRLR